MAIRALPALILAASLALSACGSGATDAQSSANPSSTSAEPVTIRLVTYDSFALSEDLIAQFEAESGIRLEIAPLGDAGELVNRAVLASGQPDGDVLFGVDTTLLSRAIGAEVFDPYVADAPIRPELADLGQGVVTPVDDGDVCVNIDDAWFADAGLAAPTTLEDLADPAYRGLLVVQNPATSSPGLAFLLATVARYGPGWPAYWQRLRENDVLVVNGWSEAYLEEFSFSGGERPLVVSYSSSPPAEIVYASDPVPTEVSTSVMADGCYRQVEFAGVLRGTPHPEQAREVVDWLLSPEVQADIPLSMFVYPARADVPLPEVFTEFVVRPSDPLELAPDQIESAREQWIEEWTETVIR